MQAYINKMQLRLSEGDVCSSDVILFAGLALQALVTLARAETATRVPQTKRKHGATTLK